MEVNNHIKDGWTSWADEWNGEYNIPKDGPLGSLDVSQVAFRGWSGSAQMVSWLMN